MKLFRNGPICNKPSFVQIFFLRRTVTKHYLNQWRTSSLMDVCVIRSRLDMPHCSPGRKHHDKHVNDAATSYIMEWYMAIVTYECQPLNIRWDRFHKVKCIPIRYQTGRLQYVIRFCWWQPVDWVIKISIKPSHCLVNALPNIRWWSRYGIINYNEIAMWHLKSAHLIFLKIML